MLIHEGEGASASGDRQERCKVNLRPAPVRALPESGHEKVLSTGRAQSGGQQLAWPK